MFYLKYELYFATVIILLGIGLSAGPLSFNWTTGEIYRNLGILLLAQGLIRDLIILSMGLKRKMVGASKKMEGICICTESAIGVASIFAFFWLYWHQSQDPATFQLKPWVVGLIFAAVWLVGFLIRDWVIQIRRAAHPVDRILDP